MERIVEFTSKAKSDLDYFRLSGQSIILKKIRQLIEVLPNDPYNGLGKPEALKHALSGLWSRRITLEHRLIYQVEDEIIYILSARGHYE